LSEQIFEGPVIVSTSIQPKQLGDVLFNKMHLPKPMKYGKGKVVSTAVDVLEEAGDITMCHGRCAIPAAGQAQVQLH